MVSWQVYYAVMLYCIIKILLVVCANPDVDTFVDDSLLAIVLASSCVLDCVNEFSFGSRQFIPRKRRHIYQIFLELGPYYVINNYRMKEETFWRLHSLIRPQILCSKRRNRKRGAIIHGDILSLLQLSMVI